MGNSKNTVNKRGNKEDKLDNVYAPVGLNISSNEVNALFAMAELLLVKNKGALSHRKDKNLRIDK